MPRRTRSISMHRLFLALGIVVLVSSLIPVVGFAQSDGAASANDGGTIATPEDAYGLWTLLPALTAIALGILSRQVILALAAGIYVAALMGLPWTHPVGSGEWVYNPLTGLQVAVDTYLVGAASNADRVRIMIFTRDRVVPPGTWISQRGAPGAATLASASC